MLVVTLSAAEKAAVDERTMQRSLEIIRRRVDKTGTREPSIQRRGADRILVRSRASARPRSCSRSSARPRGSSSIRWSARPPTPTSDPGLDNILIPSMDQKGVYYILEKRSVVTGEQLVDSQAFL